MDEYFWQHYKDEGVVVITYGSEGFEEYREYEAEYNTGWVWLFDDQRTLISDYGIGIWPSNLIIDQDFRLVWDSEDFGFSLHYLHAPVTERQYHTFVHEIQPRFQSVPRGGSVDIDVVLTNETPYTRNVEAWLDVILPGHVAFPGNPLQTQSLSIPSGFSGGQTLTLEVPEIAPLGDHRLRLSVGDVLGTARCADLTRIQVE